ncbi:hypothetical protein B5180_33415 [Streptomyces sp. BF-3]|nr:hypothetical protein B5180_33415 [Streptomyces sp. BF-3]
MPGPRPRNPQGASRAASIRRTTRVSSAGSGAGRLAAGAPAMRSYSRPSVQATSRSAACSGSGAPSDASRVAALARAARPAVSRSARSSGRRVASRLSSKRASWRSRPVVSQWCSSAARASAAESGSGTPCRASQRSTSATVSVARRR